MLRLGATAAPPPMKAGTDESEPIRNASPVRDDATALCDSPCLLTCCATAGLLPRFNVELTVVRDLVERLVLELVTGVRTTAEIKRALLGHARPLAEFFGRRDLNDLLLPLLITCLNAGEWQLRAAFFEAVASIGTYTGECPVWWKAGVAGVGGCV
jgi:hypothetical protein